MAIFGHAIVAIMGILLNLAIMAWVIMATIMVNSKNVDYLQKQMK